MKNLLTIIIVISFGNIFSQNLVPNNSFEQWNIYGPLDWETNDHIENDWFFKNGQISDYPSSDFLGEFDWDNCSYPLIYKNLGVPNNYFGIEYAYTGQAYAGVWSYIKKTGCYSISGNRQGKLSVKLIEPIINDNMTYIIRYAVSKMDNSDKTPKYKVKLTSKINGGTRKTIYDGSEDNSSGWEYKYIEYIPDVDDLQYICFEGNNIGFLNEYFAGIYIDEVIIIDKCSYELFEKRQNGESQPLYGKRKNNEPKASRGKSNTCNGRTS